ncbi:MAG: hypothetical protein QOK43_1050 [Acidimicrobiaceae bacterium]|nr:hypothetical protein [Acidimicrobiaceae bacterium]
MRGNTEGMGKALKFAFLGGLAGAGYAGYQALQQDETIEEVARKAATVGGEAAAAGLAVGFMLDRRTRRKVRAAAALAASRRSKLAGAALAAKPVMEKALEYAGQAADAARPRVEHAAEVTKERATHAAAVAKPVVSKAAKQAAEATRDYAVHAAEAARPTIEKAADAARPRVIDLRDKVVEKASAMTADVDGPRKLVLSIA